MQRGWGRRRRTVRASKHRSTIGNTILQHRCGIADGAGGTRKQKSKRYVYSNTADVDMSNGFALQDIM